MQTNTIFPATGISSCKCRDLTTPACDRTQDKLDTLLEKAPDTTCLSYTRYFKSLTCSTNGEVMDHCKKCAKTIDMHVLTLPTKLAAPVPHMDPTIVRFASCGEIVTFPKACIPEESFFGGCIRNPTTVTEDGAIVITFATPEALRAIRSGLVDHLMISRQYTELVDRLSLSDHVKLGSEVDSVCSVETVTPVARSFILVTSNREARRLCVMAGQRCAEFFNAESHGRWRLGGDIVWLPGFSGIQVTMFFSAEGHHEHPDWIEDVIRGMTRDLACPPPEAVIEVPTPGRRNKRWTTPGDSPEK
jgi:hypothetical protein